MQQQLPRVSFYRRIEAQRHETPLFLITEKKTVAEEKKEKQQTGTEAINFSPPTVQFANANKQNPPTSAKNTVPLSFEVAKKDENLIFPMFIKTTNISSDPVCIQNKLNQHKNTNTKSENIGFKVESSAKQVHCSLSVESI